MKGCLLFALGIPAGLLVLAVVVFRLNFYDIHVRYRLTVEVQDGDQLKTGSSVVEALYDIQPTWSWSGPGNYTRVVGYAPTVDLGDKGLLFLSFSNATPTPEERARWSVYFCGADSMYCLPFEAYGQRDVRTHYYDREASLKTLLRQSGPRDVPFVALPKLARIRSGDDPRLLAHVSPDNLAATFGPGVELKRVVLQLTDDPVSPMPEMWPQWLKQAGQAEGTLKGYRED